MKLPNKLKNVLFAVATMGAFATPVVDATPMVEGHQRPPMMAHGHMGEHMMKKMSRYLSLSDDQIATIETIREQAKADGESLHEAMKSYHEQIRAFKDNDTFDEQAFTSLYQQNQNTFMQLELLKVKTRHAIYQILNDEQQEKWTTLMESRKHKRFTRDD